MKCDEQTPGVDEIPGFVEGKKSVLNNMKVTQSIFAGYMMCNFSKVHCTKGTELKPYFLLGRSQKEILESCKKFNIALHYLNKYEARPC